MYPEKVCYPTNIPGLKKSIESHKTQIIGLNGIRESEIFIRNRLNVIEIDY